MPHLHKTSEIQPAPSGASSYALARRPSPPFLPACARLAVGLRRQRRHHQADLNPDLFHRCRLEARRPEAPVDASEGEAVPTTPDVGFDFRISSLSPQARSPNRDEERCPPSGLLEEPPRIGLDAFKAHAALVRMRDRYFPHLANQSDSAPFSRAFGRPREPVNHTSERNGIPGFGRTACAGCFDPVPGYRKCAGQRNFKSNVGKHTRGFAAA